MAAKHEADGLYSFSYARAYELRACSHARNAWKAKHSNRTVCVTFKVMLAQHKTTNSVSWCLLKMRDNNRITLVEHSKYWNQYCNARSYHDEVMILMDCLAARARREGILT